MSSLTSAIASYLINSLWLIPLIAATGWLMSRMLRRLGPQVEHFLWVSTLLLSVLTPAFPLYRWLPAFLPLPHSASGHSSITFVAAQGLDLKAANVFIIPTTLIVPLLFLYFIALLYFAVRLGWSIYCTATLYRNSSAVSLSAVHDELWHRCRQAFSIDEASILSSSRITGPVTMGLRKPALLMPAEFFSTCAPQDFLAALAHECAHMRRRDFQKNLLYEFASLFIAFHPVTHILKSNIAQTREMICDAMATDKFIDSRIYTQSLLRLAAMIALAPRVSPTHAIGIFDANILEKRIMVMNSKKRTIRPALKYGLLIPATLFLLSIAIAGAAKAVVIEQPSPSSSSDEAKQEGRVYRIGKDVSAPILIQDVPPDFPASARSGKYKFIGTCLLALIVDASGTPRDVKVERSLGPDFDANAIKAVQQYRFTPAMHAGQPVAVALHIEVNFRKY